MDTIERIARGSTFLPVGCKAIRVLARCLRLITTPPPQTDNGVAAALAAGLYVLPKRLATALYTPAAGYSVAQRCTAGLAQQ